MNKYKQILKENDIRCTHQRLEVLKYLDENRNHPTADMIFSDLKEENPSLSKTTVYNALNVLEDNEIIRSMSLNDPNTRYDYDTSTHYHFICEKCGRIIDFHLEYPDLEKIEEEGHIINEVVGYIKGTCNNCKSKEDREQGGERGHLHKKSK